MYSIDVSASKNLIDVTLAGFLSVEEVQCYGADLTAAFRQHQMKPGYRMRIDTSGCSAQLQEVLGAFQQHVATFPKASRIAVVNNGALTGMQLKRVLSQPYMRIFAAPDEALAWLRESESA